MKLSEHFDDSEFVCKCGCGAKDIDIRLVNKLEELHKRMNAKAIYVSSGIRCLKHNKAVTGGTVSMHIEKGACDIAVQKQDGGYYSSFTVCEQAELVGFTGIAIIDDTYAHLDIRGTIPYVNTHWFGNETNNSTYTTFKGMGEKIESKEREIKVMLEYEGRKYSGLLTEE